MIEDKKKTKHRFTIDTQWNKKLDPRKKDFSHDWIYLIRW